MEIKGWRKRLHHPKNVEDLQQKEFNDVVSSTCNVLRPCLMENVSTSVCALIIGAPSSGKSLLTRLVIQQLQQEAKCGLAVVRLSGLLHNTPAKAFQQVVYQLSAAITALPNATTVRDFDDENNNATTNVNEEDETIVDNEEKIKHLIDPSLDLLRRQKCGFLLVLDDIHRFANADPLAQTVLYSLLNLLQDRSLRAACIAQTPFVDVTNLLEKRVLSRLSHSKIVVPLPDSVDNVLGFLRCALIPSSACSSGGSKDNKSVSNTTVKTQQTTTKRRGRARTNNSRVGAAATGGGGANANALRNEIDVQWKSAVDSLLDHDRTRRAIAQHMVRTRVIAPILRAVDAAMLVCICVTDSEISIDVNEGVEIIEEYLAVVDTTVEAIMSLTQVELALLFALRRVETRASSSINEHDSTSASSTAAARKIVFADVYKEYCKLGRLDEGILAETDVSQPLVERGVAARSWELLVDGGFVVRTGNGPREGRSVYCAVAASQMEQAINKHKASTAVMKHWAKGSVAKC